MNLLLTYNLLGNSWDFADVICPPSLVLANFYFSCPLGGNGEEITSFEDDVSFNLFNFSSIIFFFNKSYPSQGNQLGRHSCAKCLELSSSCPTQ